MIAAALFICINQAPTFNNFVLKMLVKVKQRKKVKTFNNINHREEWKVNLITQNVRLSEGSNGLIIQSFN